MIRPEEPFEFSISAKKSVSISDKPFESDSRAMKIRVKVAYSCLTLSKKPPLFRNPGYAPVSINFFFRTLASFIYLLLSRGPSSLVTKKCFSTFQKLVKPDWSNLSFEFTSRIQTKQCSNYRHVPSNLTNAYILFLMIST